MDLLEVTLVPVPNSHVALFIQLRDRLLGGDLNLLGFDGSAEVRAVFDVPGQGRWSEDMVRQIDDRLVYPHVRELIDTCAERPGQWVSKSELDAVSGQGPYQLRNELSAFSKLTRRLFGDVRWPIEWMKADDGYHYRMTPAVAEIWCSLRDVRAGGGDDGASVG